MPRVATAALKKIKRRPARRRRASVLSRARYGPKTARFNRSLIKTNAVMIRRLKALQPPTVMCDWQYKEEILGVIGTDPTPTTAIQAYVLTDFSKWANVLRISSSVADAAATHIVRIGMQMRYSLVNSDWAQISVFVVTMQKDHANRDPTVSPLQSGSDFVLANNLFNPTLNSAVFSVKYCRHVTMTKNAWLTAPFQAGTNAPFAGDPFTTYKKGFINLKPNIRVRAPEIDKWKSLPYAQLPYYQRHFLLTFITQSNSAAIAVGTQCRIDMNLIATTRNTA